MYTRSILSLMNCAKEQSENWTLNRFNSNIILKHRTEAQWFTVCCHILAFVILIFEFHISADSGSSSNDSGNRGGGTTTIAAINKTNGIRHIQQSPDRCIGTDDVPRRIVATRTTTGQSH